MRPEAAPIASPRLRRALKLLVSLSFVDLAVILLLVFLHALFSVDSLVLPIQALAALLGVAAIGAIATGVAYSWRVFPQHHRAILFVVAITLATLLAHAYIIGSPGAGTAGSVSGPPGGTFNDSKLTVDTTLSGRVVNVTVTATGGDAIANVGLTSAGAELSGSGFSNPPTYASPLQPGTSATGTWDLAGSGQNSSITVSYQYLSCYSTSSKSYGCIMDEVFYVPEAMGILSGQQCSTSLSDCHMEHPYLVPALLAAGMSILGQYNAAGWRLFPALLGTFSIPLLFGIAWKVSEDKRMAYLAATLLSLDVMFFSQSSGGLLDVPPVFFGMGAFFAYFVGLKVWKFDKYAIAGVLLGVAGLAKETAVFFVLAFLAYVFFFGGGSRWYRVYAVFKVALVVGLVFAIGLQAYDSTLATSAMPTFVQHVSYIFSYGSSLRAEQLACQPTTGYWCKYPNDPGGPPILPTDWLLYYSPVAYYATSVSVCPNSVNGVCQGGAYSYVSLAYYGVTNLIETWTVFVWVPLVAYAIFRWYRSTRSPQEGAQLTLELTPPEMSGDTRLGALALVWFLGTYVPYLGLFLTQRVTYPFYFVPAIPAVALGASWWLTRDWFPRKLMWVYLAFAFLFFFVYFPEKAFLPDWLRVIIGH
jgi:hypothetical protein